MHSILTSYIFSDWEKGLWQIFAGDTNNFTLHYLKVFWQKSEDLAYFLLNISISILFALKQLQKSNTRIFYFFFKSVMFALIVFQYNLTARRKIP